MGNPEWFRPVYVLSDIWQKTGFGMILYLATLSNVDINLYEACQIDGASKFKQMLYIDVPLLFEVVVIVFILNAGQIMSSNFEKVYLMQNTVNLSVSEIISTYVYKIGLLQADFSYATAVGLFNSLVNFTLLIIVNRIIRVLKGTSLF
jgi:putative aldouronate transport system permease protein